MNTIVKAGVLLGVLCCVWTLVMGFSGWYKDSGMTNLFFLVIVIQIAVLIWALRQTAAQGRGYGGQVVAGTLISGIGGLVIVAGSMLVTTVVFPSWLSDVRAMQEQALRAKGMSDADVRQMLDMAAKGMTPIGQAIAGFIGTMVTGVCASLLIAVFVRARPAKVAVA